MSDRSVYFLSPYLRVSYWRTLWPAVELRRRGFEAWAVCRETMASWGNEAVNIELPAQSVILQHVTNQLIGHNPGGIPERTPAASYRDALTGDRPHERGMVTPGSQGLADWVRYYRKRGQRVWLQFDDDYLQLGDVQVLGQWYRDMTADHVEAVRLAHGIVCATEPIAERYGRWANAVHLCRNWIPEALTRLEVERAPGAPMAGWFGTMHAHRRDWEWLGAAAQDIHKLGVIGAWGAVSEITGRPLDFHTDSVDAGAPGGIEKLYRMVGRFSVGLAPVADDRFNAAKSWIKPLEFAALGIPCVMGEADCYRRLIDEGWPGTMVGDPDHMVKAVNYLLDERGDGAGRRVWVRDHYSIERRGGAEWEAWARAAMA